MYILGDTHRNINHVKQMIEIKKIFNDEIFHVGDFEVGMIEYNNQISNLIDLNNWLKDRGIIMYVIRGNHDNPEYFKGDHIYSNLQFLPDYTIIETQGGRVVLCIGGAISLDRVPAREQNVTLKKYNRPLTYFEDEGFILIEDILERVTGVDVVITHTAPTYCAPILEKTPPKFMNNFIKNDPKLIEEVKSERENMDKLFKILKKKNDIEYHFYGHFHRNDFTDNGFTQHIVLDKCEFFEIKDLEKSINQLVFR